MSTEIKPLFLGDLEIKAPIIQGGMGVKVSTAPLAAAVANYGGAGTIASVGLAYGTPENETDYLEASKEALRREIRKARQLTSGVIGVNVMVALTNYEDLVRVSAEEGANFIISGAGLPLKLPGFVKGYPIKLIPIVSSARAADLIIKTWEKRFKRFPDAIVVEGPEAGGHLGFKFEELTEHSADTLEALVTGVLDVVNKYKEKFDIDIPVVAGGGIFDGKDVAKFFKLGARGVQIATPFVTTTECTVAEEFKKLYITASQEDIVIIKSPVGLPGRAIKTAFVEKVMRGEKDPFHCRYKCLITCDPATVPYCIAKALCNASIGDLDNAVVFAGSNAVRVDKILSVKELMDDILSQAAEELHQNTT
jgi:nitronate monooxygenase